MVYDITEHLGCLFQFGIHWSPDSAMRKPDKANLGKLLSNNATVSKETVIDTAYVLDGGCLQHKAKWPPKGATYQMKSNMLHVTCLTLKGPKVVLNS